MSISELDHCPEIACGGGERGHCMNNANRRRSEDLRGSVRDFGEERGEERL